ncbi:MAG: VOC family protein [Phycisphaerales bacterium]|nr:VOC family protein [Phycisphaerales bacterium]
MAKKKSKKKAAKKATGKPVKKSMKKPAKKAPAKKKAARKAPRAAAAAPAPPPMPVAGDWVWHELMTTDVAGAQAFYGALFGWGYHAKEMPGFTYHLIQQGSNEQHGGMMAFQPGMEGVPPHWQLYVMVDDVDAVATRAVELGGSLVYPPMDVPSVGRMACIRDPQGAHISIYKPMMV